MEKNTHVSSTLSLLSGHEKRISYFKKTNSENCCVRCSIAQLVLPWQLRFQRAIRKYSGHVRYIKFLENNIAISVGNSLL